MYLQFYFLSLTDYLLKKYIYLIQAGPPTTSMVNGDRLTASEGNSTHQQIFFLFNESHCSDMPSSLQQLQRKYKYLKQFKSLSLTLICLHYIMRILYVLLHIFIYKLVFTKAKSETHMTALICVKTVQNSQTRSTG